MALLIAIGLGICALLFVLYPLFSKKYQRDRPATTTQALSSLEDGLASAEREQAARNALHEVELDYQLGNIASGEYQSLRERYMRRALVALKTRYDREQELDDLIEEQLRKMKEGHAQDD